MSRRDPSERHGVESTPFARHARGELGNDRADCAHELASSNAVFDSDVMFSPTRRYCLLTLVRWGLITTRWGLSLLDEWTRVIVREGQTTPEKAAYQRTKLIADFPEALLNVDHVSDALARRLVLDSNDVHVAACALAAAPCSLLTYNDSDFDIAGLAQRGIIVRDPGEWLNDLYIACAREQQHDWLVALDEHRSDLDAPALSPEEYIDRLAAVHLDPFCETTRPAFLVLPR